MLTVDVAAASERGIVSLTCLLACLLAGWLAGFHGRVSRDHVSDTMYCSLAVLISELWTCCLPRALDAASGHSDRGEVSSALLSVAHLPCL